MNVRFALLVFTLLLSACGEDTLSTADEPDLPSERPETSPHLGDAGAPVEEDAGTVDSAVDMGTRERDMSSPDTDAGVADDATTEPAVDTGLPDRPFLAPPATRGHQWVRNNPMFISGLVTSMPDPDATVVNRYYDSFGANAIHLWETGIGPELNAWLSVPRSDHRWLSWTRRDGKSWSNLQLAGGLPPNSPGRIGYQVGDEPRDWAQFQEMVVGVKALRQHDPDALIFLNMTHDTDDLDRMMQEQCNDPDFDVISYDDYSVRQGQFEWLTYFREWGLRCDKPYWRYLVSYDDAGDVDFKTATDMRWHAMVGVLYGYTGHSWFLYNIANGDTLVTPFFSTTGTWSTPTSAHDEAASINVELANLGKTLTQLTSTDVRYNPSLSLLQPDTTRPWEPGAGSDPYLSAISATGHPTQENAIGYFRDDWGDIYFAIMNPNHEGGSYQVRGTQDATIRLEFDFRSAPSNVSRAHVQALDNLSGQIERLPLTAEGPQHTLEVSLEPGELKLLKYDTGYPFVGAGGAAP